MKYFTILVAALFLSATASQAQRQQAAVAQVAQPSNPTVPVGETRSDYTLLVDSLIAPLDKSRIPGAILYDRVPATTGLHYFTAAQYSSADHLMQSYFDLSQAAYNRAAFPVSRGGLRALAEAQMSAHRQTGGDLPIAVLDYRFATLDTLAEERGTIIANGLYYDGTGNPYQDNQVTVVAAMADSVYQSVNLTLPRNLQLQNTSRSVSYAVVQVGGNQIYLSTGGAAPVTLPGIGEQVLTFTIYFTDGSTAQAKSRLVVKANLPARPANDAVISYWGAYVTGKSWTDYSGASTYGHGEVASYLYNPLSKADGKLRNPIVLLDGFDPGDKRGIQQIADEFAPLAALLKLPGKERDLVIVNFPGTYRYVTRFGTSYQLVDGGADYVERNGLVMVELLHQMKAQMQDPTEKVTVMGPSMGGLITRYALALMEKNYADASNSATYGVPYWKHNVGTWFSIDAPHQGASIPLGDQYFIDYFKNVSESAEKNLVRLNSVAAQQMLVQHQLDLGGNRFHIPFLRNLESNGLPGSLGWPTQVRRVALANGSSNGKANLEIGVAGATALQLDVARINGNKHRQFFYRSTTAGTQIAANVYFAPNAGSWGTVFNGEARVLVALVKPIAKRSEVKIMTPYNSYDVAPGGTFNAQEDIVIKTLNGKQMPGYEYRFSQVRNSHSFIPTVSSLAFQYRSVTPSYQGVHTLPSAYTDLSARALVCNDETPFDAYYVSTTTNSKHVSLDGVASQFVARELLNVSQPASFASTNATFVCLGSRTSLLLRDCTDRSGSSYTWTLTGPAVFTAANATTVTGSGLTQEIRSTGAAGTITVSVVATRTGAAPSPATTYSLEATPGTPLSLSSTSNTTGGDNCQNIVYRIDVTGLTAGPYYWSKKTVNSTTWTNFTTTLPYSTVTVWYTDMEVRCTAPSPCGVGNLPYATIHLDGVTARCAPDEVKVSPVPSDMYVEVNTQSDTEPLAVTQARFADAPDEDHPLRYQAHLYNSQGHKVKTIATRDGKVRFDTSGLPSGLYHIYVQRGSVQTSRNIQIAH